MEKALDWLAGQWREVATAFGYYVRLRTSDLILLSDWRPKGDGIRLSAALFLTAVVFWWGAQRAIFGDSQDALPGLARAVALNLVLILAIWSPVFAVYFLFRRPYPLFLVNLQLIGHSFAAVVFIVATGILLAHSQTRVDVNLFLSGQGRATPMGEQICGDLERQAMLAKLNRYVSDSNWSMSRDFKEMLTWGPPTLQTKIAHQEDVLRFRLRRQERIEQAFRSVRAVIEIRARMEMAKNAYRRAYPTVPWAFRTFVAGVVGISLMSLIHVWRGVGGGIKATIAVAISLMASTAITVFAGFVLGPPTVHMEELERQFAEIDQLPNDEARATRLDELDRGFDQEEQNLESRLRQQFILLKHFCPYADDQGLWRQS